MSEERCSVDSGICQCGAEKGDLITHVDLGVIGLPGKLTQSSGLLTFMTHGHLGKYNKSNLSAFQRIHILVIMTAF